MAKGVHGGVTMKKFLSIFLAIIIVGLTVILGIQEPIIAKAEEAKVNSFINDTVELIRENDVGKNFIIEETEESQGVTLAALEEEPSDTTFQACRLIVKSDNSVDKLNSIGMASGFQNYHIVQFATEKDTENAYNIYLSDENIISVTPDKVYNATCDYEVDYNGMITYKNNPPQTLESWGSKVTGLYDVKHYIELNNFSLDEIVVGVLDSGIDLNHEFFKDRIVRTLFNSASDGDESNETDISSFWHGTSVSSVIVDSTPQNVKVANYRFINAQDQSTVTATVSAILAAIDDKVDIINASFLVADESGIIQDALNEAHKASIPIIAGAGNDSWYIETFSSCLPAADEKVITVAALSENWLPTSWTAYSRCVDLIAPGENINTAYGKNAYCVNSGTSFSAPLVSALVAMLKTVYPNCSTNEIEMKIESTANPTDLIADSDLFGYGVIDAISACGFKRTDTPIVNYDSGKYIGEIQVEISADIDCEVYYTIDGSYPTKNNGTLYTEPINLSNDILYFKAIAYSENLLKSECVKRFYRLQTVGVDNSFTISEEGKILSYTDDGIVDLIIPESINGITVSDIQSGTFSEATFLGVSLPNCLKNVPSGSFLGNQTLMFAEGANVTTIESAAFYNCPNLYSVDFPLTETIGNQAFYCTVSLSQAEFYNCREIGNRAFMGDSCLRRAYFPSLNIMGYDCFNGCSMLSDVYVPNLNEFTYWSNKFGGQFAACELFNGLDLPCVEEIGLGTFHNSRSTIPFSEYSYLSKLEFSNVKELKSLPIGLCSLYNISVRLVLPSTLQNCSANEITNATSDWYIVYGTEGTYAEKWAKENGFEFIAISEENKEAAIITKLPESYYSYMRPLEADVAGFNKTYQWYGANSDDNTDAIIINGATERKFDPNKYKQYKYYFCVVTSTDVGYEPIEIRTGVTENKSYIPAEEPEKELADYAALDEVISEIPEDLTIYTEESVANLKAVEESIDRNLDITNQEKISEYVEAIKNAIDSLEVKPADYSVLNAVLTTVPTNLSIYTDETVVALNDVINSIDKSLDITKQEKIGEYVIAITNAIAALELKSADYAELEEVLKTVPNDLSIYTDASSADLKTILAEINKNLDITNQEQVDKWAEAIPAAVEKLVLKPADYSELKKALATVPSDLSIYTEESVFALQKVIDSIDYSLDITQQEKVDEYVKQIDNAVNNLKKECWFIRFIKAIISFFNRILMNIKLLFS